MIILCHLLSGLGRAEPSPDNQVVIVGGGLAGLSAAASLSKAGFDVVLLEASNYLGSSNNLITM